MTRLAEARGNVTAFEWFTPERPLRRPNETWAETVAASGVHVYRRGPVTVEWFDCEGQGNDGYWRATNGALTAEHPDFDAAVNEVTQ